MPPPTACGTRLIAVVTTITFNVRQPVLPQSDSGRGWYAFKAHPPCIKGNRNQSFFFFKVILFSPMPAHIQVLSSCLYHTIVSSSRWHINFCSCSCNEMTWLIPNWTYGGQVGLITCFPVMQNCSSFCKAHEERHKSRPSSSGIQQHGFYKVVLTSTLYKYFNRTVHRAHFINGASLLPPCSVDNSEGYFNDKFVISINRGWILFIRGYDGLLAAKAGWSPVFFASDWSLSKSHS